MIPSSHGRILKVHGLKGALKIKLYEEFKFKGAPEHLFLWIESKEVPFFLESFKAQGISAVIQFDEIAGFNSLDEMLGIEFRFPENCLDEIEVDQEQSLIDFQVIDEEHGALGAVVDILEVGGQFYLIIEQGEVETILPFVDEFILNIDKDKEEIFVQCPEGLLGLNQ